MKSELEKLSLKYEWLDDDPLLDIERLIRMSSVPLLVNVRARIATRFLARKLREKK